MSQAGRAGTLPAALARAYRRTLYSIDAASSVQARIGRRSAASDGLLRRMGAREAVLVTAWNPRSRRMPAGWNRRMQHALAARLRRRCVLKAQGAWRGWQEAHLLVFGPAQPVLVLARCFRQRAVVVLRPGRPARLTVMPAA